jgi:hypothetical protein
MRIAKNDREAFDLAIKLTLAEDDEGRREQIKWKLKEDGFINTGKLAGYHRQCEALQLKPWEEAPCHVDDPDEPIDPNDARLRISGYAQAAKLLREMLALGISRWHPDPLAAIEEAKKARR